MKKTASHSPARQYPDSPKAACSAETRPSLEPARRDVLIAARRIEIDEQAAPGHLRSDAAPVAGQLGLVPKIARNCAGEPEHWPIVEIGKQPGRQIGDGRFVRRNGTPILQCRRRFRLRKVGEPGKVLLGSRPSACQEQEPRLRGLGRLAFLSPGPPGNVKDPRKLPSRCKCPRRRNGPRRYGDLRSFGKTGMVDLSLAFA